MPCYESHAIAGIFPELSGIAFDELCDDIEQNGLRSAIILHEGQVLDGRNRLRACAARGIEPRFEVWLPTRPGDTPLSFAISQNLARRHLSDDVRALIAEKIADFRRGGAGAHHPEKFTTMAQAARLLNVATSKVKVARDVRLYGEPADIARVQAGAAKLGTVRNEVLTRIGKAPPATPATIAKQQRQADAARPDAMPRLLKAIDAARRGLKLAASGEKRGFYNTVQRCLQRGTPDEITALEAGNIDLYTLDAQCAARTEPTLNLKATRGLMAQIVACSDRLALLDAIEDRAAKLEGVAELVDRVSKDRRREVLRKVVGALRLPLNVSGNRWEQSSDQPKLPAETPEEFIARGGTIVRMPTAIVAPGTGRVSADDGAAIGAHEEKRVSKVRAVAVSRAERVNRSRFSAAGKRERHKETAK